MGVALRVLLRVHVWVLSACVAEDLLVPSPEDEELVRRADRHQLRIVLPPRRVIADLARVTLDRHHLLDQDHHVWGDVIVVRSFRTLGLGTAPPTHTPPTNPAGQLAKCRRPVAVLAVDAGGGGEEAHTGPLNRRERDLEVQDLRARLAPVSATLVPHPVAHMA